MLNRLRVKRHFIEDEGWTAVDWEKFTAWLTKKNKHPNTHEEWELAAMEWVNT